MANRSGKGAVRAGIVALLVIAGGVNTAAWNARFHRAIATAAAERLTPQTAEQIRMLLSSEADPSLERASTWADEIRINPLFRFSTLGHFIEIPLTSDASDLSRYCSNGDCVTASLTTVGRALVDESLSLEKRAQALKFFVHLIADIHQPLHCAGNDDVSGSKVQIVLDGSHRTNLHVFWDGLFLGETSEQDIVQRINQRITPTSAAGWSIAADPTAWARECFGVAKATAYGDPELLKHAAPVALSAGYQQAVTQVGVEQAAKAAVRMAGELNRMLGSQSKPNITSWFYPAGRPDREPAGTQHSEVPAPAATRLWHWIAGGTAAVFALMLPIAWTVRSRKRDVFVSYRRKPSEGDAGRVCDRLGAAFGRTHVFRDVTGISGGTDFGDAIDRRLASCDAVVAVIGPEWASDPRLQDPDDWVRRELSRALATGITVIPVLVRNAAPLDADALPDDLRPLCRRQAIRISDELFDASTASLVRAIRTVPKRRGHAG